jgi:hypothetical protein
VTSPWEICTCTGKESCSLCEGGTITPESRRYFEGIAAAAEKDLDSLPESSQPLWYRLHKQAMIQG